MAQSACLPQAGIEHSVKILLTTRFAIQACPSPVDGSSFGASGGASFITFSGFFFSASLTLPFGLSTADKRPLIRSFFLSFIRFLLLASSRSFSRLGIDTSFSNSDFGMSEYGIHEGNYILNFYSRTPQSATSQRISLCTLGQSAEMTDFLHRSTRQEDGIRFLLCKKGRTNANLHSSSPS